MDWLMAAEASKRLPFGRAMRIKQGRDFSRVRLEGKRLVHGCLIANWRSLPAGSPTRLGVVTGAKLGGAVVRNRARRLMRELPLQILPDGEYKLRRGGSVIH